MKPGSADLTLPSAKKVTITALPNCIDMKKKIEKKMVKILSENKK